VNCVKTGSNRSPTEDAGTQRSMIKMGQSRLLERIKLLLVMTKPTQLALLMWTMYGAYFIGGGSLNLKTLLLLFLTGLGSAGGVTALNMYIESDIDKIMPRTSKRPLPSGALSQKEAIAGITLLILVGTIAAGLINKWVMLATLIGLYFDIIAYTEIAKRSTEWSLLFGSVAGSMPALGGWAAATGKISLPGVLLAGIVYVWQPLHVAFIHYYYYNDYSRAGIPTIPGELGTGTFALLAVFSVIMVPLILFIFIVFEKYGIITLIITIILVIKSLRKIKLFSINPSREAAREMIKYASPLVGVVFLLLPLEHILAVSVQLKLLF